MSSFLPGPSLSQDPEPPTMTFPEPSRLAALESRLVLPLNVRRLKDDEACAAWDDPASNDGDELSAGNCVGSRKNISSGGGDVDDVDDSDGEIGSGEFMVKNDVPKSGTCFLLSTTMADKVNFRALQHSNEQRNAYGLRYHDFARYRKHCANRTHRLRSSLKLTHGKGRDFKKLPPLKTEIIKDGHLQLLLMEAERAWAYSQELLAQSRKDEDHARTLHHTATGRFRRSVNWSTQLLSHSQALYADSRLSAESLLEVTVYTLILNGRFLRYREDFEDALVQLSVARQLLDELAGAARTSRDQALATLFADEIGPEIRYCAHELGRSEAYNIDKIVAEVAGKHRNSLVEGCDKLLEVFRTEGSGGDATKRRKLEEIVWDGEPVPVRNPELVDVFLKVQEAQAKLAVDGQAKSNKKSVAAYDAILHALSDAEEVARKLVEAQQTAASSAPSGSRDISFIHAYIVYQLLSRRVQRDLRLLQALLPTPSSKTSTKAPNVDQTDGRVYPAIVKLLDTIMQSLNQMRALSIVDDNPDLSSGVDARISFTKAERCLHLARCFSSVKQYAQTLTLYKHSSIHVRETQSHLSISPAASPELSFFPLGADEISHHQAEVAADERLARKEWLAYNGGSKDLDPKTYKKPPFFNIALNYVELDMEGLMRRAGLEVPDEQPAKQESAQPEKTRLVEEEVVREKTPEPHLPSSSSSKGSLSGLLGGWWGK